MLQSLVNQDARGMIDWLGREVTAWGERHAAWEDYLAGIARFWARRAGHTAETLEQLSRRSVTAKCPARASRSPPVESQIRVPRS